MHIADPIFHQTNLEFLIHNLLNNGYPLAFIFSCINKKLKRFIFHKKIIDKTDNSNNNDKFFTIPYVKNISERLANIVKSSDCKTSYSCIRTLNTFINTGKDKLTLMSHNDVVYRISCKECEATYVGQTKRQLKTRIKEHRSDINKTSGLPSVISNHRLEFDHEFDWDNVSVLDKEKSYTKRLISEMVHITIQPNALNKQTDTEFLSEDYLPLIDRFCKG